MPDIDVLLTVSLLPGLREALPAGFKLHDLKASGGLDALPPDTVTAIRAIACGPMQPLDGAFMDRFPNLEIIASFGVGYDHVDAEAAVQRGLIVTNTPDVLTEEVADTAIGMMIMTARELSVAERWLRAGNWRSGYPLTRGTLRNKTLGIFGLGRIGKAIAKRAEAMGMRIAYHGRRAQPDVPYTYCASLAELAECSDILLSVAPGGAATAKVIDADIFRALGKDGIFINIGRGSVVDEPALVEALQSRTILSAGLDVFANEPHVPAELIEMDHVVLLPHVGSASIHTRNEMGRLQGDNLTNWFLEGAPLTPVAETPWPRD